MGGCLRKFKQIWSTSKDNVQKEMQEQNQVNELLEPSSATDTELAPHLELIKEIQGFSEAPDEDGMPLSQVEKNNYSRFLQGLNGTGRHISKCILQSYVSTTDISDYFSLHSLWVLFDDDQIQTIKGSEIEKFDNTLIYKILTTLSTKIQFDAEKLPTRGWGKEPSIKDFTIGDELERIRLLDEYVKSHSAETSLPKLEYKEKWGQFKDIARRMKKLSGKDVYKELCNLETVNITLEHFKKLQKLAEDTLSLDNSYSDDLIGRHQIGLLRNLISLDQDSDPENLAKNQNRRLIKFSNKDLITKGSDGTRVYRGKFDGRDVAVKRMQRENDSLMETEIEVLLSAHNHDNIVKYYYQEKDENFLYIALELCAGTIEDFINGNESFPGLNPKDVCFQMMSGIEYLHAKNIIHRDVKPNNILLRRLRKLEYVAVVADFGLSRVMSDTKMSITNTSCAVGTFGWWAPEVLRENGKCGFASDIFSAGLVICYLVSNGKHAFGDLDSGISVLTKEGPHHLLQILPDDQSIERDMIEDMIQHSPEQRPTAKEVLEHPYFLDTIKKIDFIQRTSDALLKQNAGQILDEPGHKIFNKQGWKASVSPHLVINLDGKQRKGLDKTSVRSLLRAFRNTLHHIKETPPEVRRDVGNSSEDVFNYFHNKFPLLFIYIYNKIPPPENEYKSRRCPVTSPSSNKLPLFLEDKVDENVNYLEDLKVV